MNVKFSATDTERVRPFLLISEALRVESTNKDDRRSCDCATRVYVVADIVKKIACTP